MVKKAQIKLEEADTASHRYLKLLIPSIGTLGHGLAALSDFSCHQKYYSASASNKDHNHLELKVGIFYSANFQSRKVDSVVYFNRSIIKIFLISF